MASGSITDVLERLASGQGVDSAWTAFLDRYSPLILQVARRYESHRDRALDCFVFVCGALADDGFRRLLKYRPDTGTRFETWLRAVVANLCIDWRRQQQGRLRPVQAIAGLSDLDQLVYRCLYVLGMRRDECLRALRPRFPALTDGEVSEINARLFALLTPRQRWQLGARMAGFVSMDDAESPIARDGGLQVADPGPGPEHVAEDDEERARIAEAMARLPARQRLLLKLRFDQELTLAEVARLAGIPDVHRANRQIQAALAELARLLDARKPG
jgi:RNA polymerase sigma factor (sigma-70 family)